MERSTKNVPITRTLTRLQPGQDVKFPIRRTLTIRTTISNISLKSAMKFKTRTDRQAGTVTVIRES